MSAPYLNRGESIVLTTHRVSLDSVVYDAMLTNERLILMDSRYTRIEPKIIPFPAIVTVKGGKASTGEPALILTLEEVQDLSGSGQVILIFTQQPGEKRKHERELWVKRLIELVITAREKVVQNAVVPVKRKTGMQPSVRRWEAPESPRPHSSVIETPAILPEKVILTEEEPDPLEFFLEEQSSEKTEPAPEELKEFPGPVAGEETPAEDFPAHPGLSGKDMAPVWPVIPNATRYAEPSPSGDPVQTESPPAVIPASLPLTEPEQVTGGSSAAFASTILAAAQSLQEHAEEQRTPEDESPRPEVLPEIDQAPVKSPAESDTLPVRERAVTKTTPLPLCDREKEAVVPPVSPTPGEKRELPGTYTPAIPPLSPKKTAPATRGAKEREGFPVAITAAVLLIAAIVLVGGIALAVYYLQGSAYGNTVVTTTHSAVVTQIPSPAPVPEQPVGVRVDVKYPGAFTGIIGSPGLLRQVSGTGNQTFAVIMTTSIVQATIRKQDNSGDTLTVEIYNNSSMIARQTITAPGGEINLLIDTQTTQPPGMTASTPPAGTNTLPGNGSLVYF